MKYHSYQVPRNVPIWGYAFKPASTKDNMAKSCKPVLGMVKGDNYWGEFYEFRKDNSTLKQSGSVSASYRLYADTREEAVEHYNQLVNEYIKYLYDLAEEFKGYLAE